MSGKKKAKKRRRDRSGGIGVGKYVIAILAIINLVLLFGFDYQIPGVSSVISSLIS